MISTQAVNMEPEAEILLHCARTHVDATGAERLREILQTDIDWQYLIHQAFRHSVLPLLYWNVHTTCEDAVPSTILAQLRHAFHTQARHNLLLNSTLFSLLALFEEHGIPAIPYKGPVLATTVYGNLLIRQFSDLDLLVPPQDLLRAKELLLSHAYRPCEQASVEQNRLTAPCRKIYGRIRKKFRMVCELVGADGQVVELHPRVTSWTFFFPLEPVCLWERCGTTSLAGTPVRNLPPEETLLILCVHGAKHHWVRLGWICDIAELLRVHQSLNWHRTMAEANKLGGRRMLLLGLLLAHDLLGASVPTDILRQIRADRNVTWLAAKVREQLFIPTAHELDAVERPMFYLRLRERLRDKVRCSYYLAYHTVRSFFKQVDRGNAEPL